MALAEVGDSNANSGIFLHIADLKNPFPKGIECNLQAGRAGLFVLLGRPRPCRVPATPGRGTSLLPLS